jgi:hypothetical protein
MNAIRDRIEQVKQIRKKTPSNKQSKVKEAKATTSSDGAAPSTAESVGVETS